MNTRKLWTVVLSLVIGCAALLPLARASEASEQTQVTFNAPVEIPGQVLPAGTYLFVVTGDIFNRNFVRISSLDGKTVYATEITAPAVRLEPADGMRFIFAERAASQPEALLKWFFPGETTGHEFEYPKQEEKELARDQQQVVAPDQLGESQVHAGF